MSNGSVHTEIHTTDTATHTATHTVALQALSRAMGGRITKESANDPLFSLSGMGAIVTPPSNAEDVWRLERLDMQSFEKMPPHRLLELLCELSPDISRALWDFLRMCNPGWTCKAYRISATGQNTLAIDLRAQQACDDFISTLKALYGDFNLVVNKLFIQAFLRGAMFSELIIAPDGMTPVDLAMPDPLPVRFEATKHPIRGTIFRPFEMIGGERVYIDIPTILYLPIDPFPGNPYGRALASPALFSTLFLLALLHDIRRVVQQQGYPRIDISIDLEVIQQTFEALEDMPNDMETWKGVIDAAVQQVADMYARLQPDEAYVHTSMITINRPVGTVDSSSLSGIQGIIDVLERWSIRALKTVPIVHGQAGAVTESNANRQWEIFAAGVKSIQHAAEVLLEGMFQFALRTQGIASKVEFRFSELRVAELLRDTQVDLLRMQVAKARYDQGYESQDEGALYATGKEKADQEEPRVNADVDTTGAGAIASAQPDPGSTRGVWDYLLAAAQGEQHARSA